MDFWELTKLLFRRWYFSAPMLVLSVAIAMFAGASVKPDYKAKQHLQLIPPVATAGPMTGKPHNPWNDLGAAAIGNAAIIGVSDSSVLGQLTASGLSDTFTVTIDPRSPIVTVEVVGRSSKQATDTAEMIVKLFQQKVAGLQTTYGVPPDQLITTHGLDTGSNVETVTSKVKRALAVIGGVGLLLTAAVTIGLDALLRNRSRRRAGVVEAKPAAEVMPQPQRSASGRHDIEHQTVRIGTAGSEAVPQPRRANGNPGRAANPSTNADATAKDHVEAAAGPNGQGAPKILADSEATIVLPMQFQDSWVGRGGKERRR